jgi:hypothetical protein
VAIRVDPRSRDALYEDLDRRIDDFIMGIANEYRGQMMVKDWLYVGNLVKDRIFMMLLESIGTANKDDKPVDILWLTIALKSQTKIIYSYATSWSLNALSVMKKASCCLCVISVCVKFAVRTLKVGTSWTQSMRC